MNHKRLVVCCDGTWNDADSAAEFTNVVRTARAIKPIDGRSDPAIPQIVYYHSGVGTSDAFNRVVGGAVGLALSRPGLSRPGLSRPGLSRNVAINAGNEHIHESVAVRLGVVATGALSKPASLVKGLPRHRVVPIGTFEQALRCHAPN